MTAVDPFIKFSQLSVKPFSSPATTVIISLGSTLCAFAPYQTAYQTSHHQGPVLSPINTTCSKLHPYHSTRSFIHCQTIKSLALNTFLATPVAPFYDKVIIACFHRGTLYLIMLIDLITGVRILSSQHVDGRLNRFTHNHKIFQHCSFTRVSIYMLCSNLYL